MKVGLFWGGKSYFESATRFLTSTLLFKEDQAFSKRYIHYKSLHLKELQIYQSSRLEVGKGICPFVFGYVYLPTLVYLINVLHNLLFFLKNSSLHGLIPSCTFINFGKFSRKLDFDQLLSLMQQRLDILHILLKCSNFQSNILKLWIRVKTSEIWIFWEVD